MKVTFVELRHKSRDVFRALKRNERVTLLYRGKPTAVMHPVTGEGRHARMPACEHPAFGMWADRNNLGDVATYVRNLRKGRHHAL